MPAMNPPSSPPDPDKTRESRAYGALLGATGGLLVGAPLWLMLGPLAPPGDGLYLVAEWIGICALLGAYRPRLLPDAIAWVVRGLGAPRQ